MLAVVINLNSANSMKALGSLFGSHPSVNIEQGRVISTVWRDYRKL